MRGARQLVRLGLAGVVTLLAPSPAGAEDNVHTCIDASTSGQTLRNAGKLVAARQQMIQCARDACPTIVRSHCARWLGEIEGMIPSIVVRAQDAAGADLVDARVSIDGAPGKLDGQPVSLDPGPHTVTVSSATGAVQESKVLLVAGDRSRLVTLRFKPERTAAPAAQPSPSARHVPVGAWILGGAGIVALGTGAAFVVAASSQLDQLKSSCSPHCSSAQTQPGRTDSLAGDILLGAGGAALGAALVWAFVFPSVSSDTSTGMQVRIAPLLGGAATSFALRW
jgi:hypothetical protein